MARSTLEIFAPHKEIRRLWYGDSTKPPDEIKGLLDSELLYRDTVFAEDRTFRNDFNLILTAIDHPRIPF